MKPQSVSMNADSGEKTWLTPRYIIDALGPFDLDPCCPDGGMPWQTARQMIAKSEDGLKADWNGKRVWLNPPYGREALPFFEKMIAQNTGGGLPLCSHGRTLRCGKTTSSRTRTRCCSFAAACDSAIKTAQWAKRQPLRLRLWRSAGATLRFFRLFLTPTARTSCRAISC